MLSEALSYPRQGEGWLKRIGIGGILYFLGFLVLPIILVEGYLYRVLRGTVRDASEPPAWDDWVELFVEGIKMLVVQLGYALVPVIVFTIGTALAVAGLDTTGAIVNAVGAVLTILIFYLVPAALTNFAYTESVSAAFSIERIREVAFTRPYFVHIVMSLVLGIVLGIIGTILSWIIIGIFILFYAQVAVYYLWARGFANSLDLATTA